MGRRGGGEPGRMADSYGVRLQERGAPISIWVWEIPQGEGTSLGRCHAKYVHKLVVELYLIRPEAGHLLSGRHHRADPAMRERVGNSAIP